jgi:hypothetical protein
MTLCMPMSASLIGRFGSSAFRPPWSALSLAGSYFPYLANVIGEDPINSLVAHTGMSRDELLAGLSQILPQKRTNTSAIGLSAKCQ